MIPDFLSVRSPVPSAYHDANPRSISGEGLATIPNKFLVGSSANSCRASAKAG